MTKPNIILSLKKAENWDKVVSQLESLTPDELTRILGYLILNPKLSDKKEEKIKELFNRFRHRINFKTKYNFDLSKGFFDCYNGFNPTQIFFTGTLLTAALLANNNIYELCLPFYTEEEIQAAINTNYEYINVSRVSPGNLKFNHKDGIDIVDKSGILIRTNRKNEQYEIVVCDRLITHPINNASYIRILKSLPSYIAGLDEKNDLRVKFTEKYVNEKPRSTIVQRAKLGKSFGNHILRWNQKNINLKLLLNTMTEKVNNFNQEIASLEGEDFFEQLLTLLEDGSAEIRSCNYPLVHLLDEYESLKKAYSDVLIKIYEKTSFLLQNNKQEALSIQVPRILNAIESLKIQPYPVIFDLINFQLKINKYSKTKPNKETYLQLRDQYYALLEQVEVSDKEFVTSNKALLEQIKTQLQYQFYFIDVTVWTYDDLLDIRNKDTDEEENLFNYFIVKLMLFNSTIRQQEEGVRTFLAGNLSDNENAKNQELIQGLINTLRNNEEFSQICTELQNVIEQAKNNQNNKNLIKACEQSIERLREIQTNPINFITRQMGKNLNVSPTKLLPPISFSQTKFQGKTITQYLNGCMSSAALSRSVEIIKLALFQGEPTDEFVVSLLAGLNTPNDIREIIQNLFKIPDDHPYLCEIDYPFYLNSAEIPIPSIGIKEISYLHKKHGLNIVQALVTNTEDITLDEILKYLIETDQQKSTCFFEYFIDYFKLYSAYRKENNSYFAWKEICKNAKEIRSIDFEGKDPVFMAFLKDLAQAYARPYIGENAKSDHSKMVGYLERLENLCYETSVQIVYIESELSSQLEEPVLVPQLYPSLQYFSPHNVKYQESLAPGYYINQGEENLNNTVPTHTDQLTTAANCSIINAPISSKSLLSRNPGTLESINTQTMLFPSVPKGQPGNSFRTQYPLARASVSSYPGLFPPVPIEQPGNSFRTQSPLVRAPVSSYQGVLQCL